MFDKLSLRSMVLDGAPRTGITFLGQGADAATAPAERLADSGSSWFAVPGDDRAVAAILTNDRASVELVLGCIVAGVRLVSLPIPHRGADPAEYAARIRAHLATAGATKVVVADEWAGVLADAGIPSLPHSWLAEGSLSVESSGFSLVQFTSGTTGAPAGVEVGDRELGANVAAILDRTAAGPGDSTVSWLPLSHDMGLIGMLLATVAAGAEPRCGSTSLAIMDPSAFLRRPGVWLEALSERGATFTASPDFGLRLAARRAAANRHLGRVRCLIVGGEIVRGDTLTTFAAATGCSAAAICPAYGLAEVGLAVSIDVPGEPWTAVDLDPDQLAAGTVRPSSDGALSVVRCGAPLDGYDVTVAAGRGEIGPIGVTGPSIGSDPASGRPLGRPVLATGDLGFVDHDGLAVVGRSDDTLNVHGRRVNALFVEDRIGHLDGVRAGRAAVGVLPDGRLVVAAEAAAGANPTLPDDVRRVVVAAIGASPDEVLLLDPGALPVTSSGKLRRGGVMSIFGGVR